MIFILWYAIPPLVGWAVVHHRNKIATAKAKRASVGARNDFISRGEWW